MASHELKTPITALRAFLQLFTKKMHEGNMDGYQLTLDRMNKQTEKILDLVDAMLNATKAKAGQLNYHLKPIDLRYCVRESVAAVQAGEHTHYIDVQMPDNEFNISADDIRIGQVITNLLSNAIKYSPGRERVQLWLESLPGEVKIVVKDEGISIPQEKLKRVFDRFYRVDSLPAGKYVGLGLGLFIASEIVHQHKGRIGVESEEGIGTSFWFTLPVITA